MIQLDSKFLKSKTSKTIIVLSFVLITGAFLRFYKLGNLPIEGDNVYHALAVNAIETHGIPLMPSGVIYLRSVPLMYLQTLSSHVFFNKDTAIRVPSAIFGVLNILLIYIFCKMLGRKNEIGLIGAFLFAVSPVAIYFSRMPRMYETFLFSILATWICFYLWYYRNSTMYLPGVIFFSLLSITLHRSAIVPMVCYLIPILIDSRLSKKLIASVSIFLFIILSWAVYPMIIRWGLSLIHSGGLA